MRRTILAAAALAAVLWIGASANRAGAMTAASPSALGIAAGELSPVQQVYWRRWHHYHHWGWRHRYWGWRPHYYWRAHYYPRYYYYPRPYYYGYYRPCCWGWHRPWGWGWRHRWW